MQFTSILAVLSFALAASANPINVERTGTPTPGQQAQNNCPASSTVSCCNTKKGPISGILPITGGDCSPISLVSLLPISSQCSGNTQQVACCPNSGSQSGFINVGSICAPIAIPISL